MLFRRHEEAAQTQTRRLLGLFVLVVIGLVVAINLVLAAVYWISFPFARDLPDHFVATNTALVLLFVLGGCWVESTRLAKGGPRVAELAGARPVNTGGYDETSLREKRFAHIVQEMALASGLRQPPQAWVLPRDDAINALAAGWEANDAVVAVTRGALERLDRAELMGVVAHEFSHIAHGDTRLNMRLVGLVWGLQMIWGLGRQLWSADEQGRRHFGALFGLGLMAVGSFGWLAGRLLQAAVSRQREFLADASAVKFTRQIDGLGGALRKIGEQQVRRVPGLASAHAAALAHLLLAHGPLAPPDGWRRWLATHPTLAERLGRLYGRELASDEQFASADPLPIEALDEPPSAIAVSSLAARVESSAPMPAGSSRLSMAATDPQAHRDDAMQRATSFDAAAREREALARIALWHGPGEWQAAMLALAIDAEAPGVAGCWHAYEAATQDLHVAATVRAEVDALGPAARRRVFASLLERVAVAAPAQRIRLWRDWSARWRQLPPRPGSAWRALVIRHALGGHGIARAARGTLASEAAAARAATRAIAAAMGLGTDSQARWIGAAMQRLEALGMPRPRGPAAGLAPQVLARERGRALQVRRLSPMQRPLLLRAWIEASETTGAIRSAEAVDALHLACVALELPVPPALAG